MTNEDWEKVKHLEERYETPKPANPAFLYRQYMCKPSTVLALTPHQAKLLIGMLEDAVNDEDFKYAYNETDRNALKEVYEKYKQLV